MGATRIACGPKLSGLVPSSGTHFNDPVRIGGPKLSELVPSSGTHFKDPVRIGGPKLSGLVLSPGTHFNNPVPMYACFKRGRHRRSSVQELAWPG